MKTKIGIDGYANVYCLGKLFLENKYLLIVKIKLLLHPLRGRESPCMFFPCLEVLLFGRIE